MNGLNRFKNAEPAVSPDVYLPVKMVPLCLVHEFYPGWTCRVCGIQLRDFYAMQAAERNL